MAAMLKAISRDGMDSMTSTTRITNESTHPPNAVSYTHLDVYKRQAEEREHVALLTTELERFQSGKAGIL